MSFNYIANDPKLPLLTEEFTCWPFQDGQRINVKGFNFQSGTTTGAPAAAKIGLGASAYCSVRRAMDVFMANLPNGVEVTQWASRNKNVLPVTPLKAKTDLNAYYNRKELAFFYNNFNGYGWVYAALSPDVVCHETGHALWDALRPDGWSVATLEANAYHEAFAECMAVATAIESDITANSVLTATGGNINTVNDITYTAEEFGYIFENYYDIAPYAVNDFWGSMINNFTYVLPSTLPANGEYSELLKEPHSFARVWDGAWYDMIVAVYNSLSGTQLDRFRNARNIVLGTQLRAMKDVVFTSSLYAAIGNEMLTASETSEFGSGAYTSIFENVFANRNIGVMSRAGLRTKKVSDYSFNEPKVVRNKHHTKVYERNQKSIRIRDYYKKTRQNDLYDVLVPTCFDNSYHFNDKGILLRETTSDSTTTIAAVKDYLDYLKDNDLVGKHKKATHVVSKNGVLKRRKICS